MSQGRDAGSAARHPAAAAPGSPPADGSSAATLLEAFQTHLAQSPEKDACVFLGNGAEESARLSYARLHARALGVADALRRHGCDGAPVLLAYPPGLEFLVALLGSFYAGAVAVPVPLRLPRDAARSIAAIAADCRPAAVLSTAGLIGERRQPSPAPAALRWIVTEGLGAGGPHRSGPLPDPSAMALVQYSSGSTGAPRGVAISHANLAHTHATMASVFDHRAESVGVTWVPAYHDMGLGALLQMLYCGGTNILLPPLRAMQHPFLWLQAISRYRANSTVAPSFAYELCLRRIDRERRRRLDLRSWQVAICGAEPVRAEVLEGFAAAFAEVGFAANAFLPAYGLAEATLLAACAERGEALRVRAVDPLRLARGEVAPASGDRVRRLVSCGFPRRGQRVAIVDPTTRRLVPAGAVGEIWLAGESVARGYWRRPALSERIFRARIEGGGEEGYLRTGDLGFVGEEGLFVTGRLKDLLIMRGRNYYPEDLEDAVRLAHPALANGRAAAFGFEAAGEEALVIAFEPTRDAIKPESLAAAVATAVAAVSRGFGLRLHDFVVLRPGGLPRTTSGKVQRARCRALYLEAALPVLMKIGGPVGLGRGRAPLAESVAGAPQ